MAWDDTPPSKAEQKALASWDSEPPTEAELAGPEDVTKLTSFLMGGAKGLPFVGNAVPAIVGAAKASPDALQSLLGDKHWEDVKAHYNQARESYRNDETAADKANPGTFLAGQIGAGLATAPLLPGMSALKMGALLGSTGTLGNRASEGKSVIPTSKEEALDEAKDLAIGTGGGAILGGTLGKVGDKLAARSLAKNAAERAVKATGANKTIIKNMLKSPTFGEGAENRLIEHGENLLKKNPYQDESLVTSFSKPEQILERAQDLEQKAGGDIGNILKKLDNSFKSANPMNEDMYRNFYNPNNSISKVEAIQKQFTKNGEILPLYKGEYEKLQDVIDTMKKFGDRPISFQDANEIKQLISKTAYNNEGKLTDELLGNVRGIVNDDIEQAADKVAKSVNDPEIAQRYLSAKDWYRTAKDASNAALGKTAANLVNRDLGITDYLSAVAGGAAHGVPGLAVAAGANKVAKTYGNSAASQMLYKGSKVSKFLFDSSPDKLRSFGQNLAKGDSEIGQRLGRVLAGAADKDNIGRNAVMFSLLQNPSYREMLESLQHKDDTAE